MKVLKKLEVLPVINCIDFKTAKAQIKIAERFLKKGDFIHLDISDGKFTFNKSWRNPSEWANLRSKLNLEAHLMVEDPEKYVDVWIAAGARRFIVHAETLTEDSAKKIVARAKKRGIEVMLASKPHTTAALLWTFLKTFSHFQVLAVDPGPSGQKFLPIVLKKIQFLRNFAPHAMIEVDGGVNKDVAKLVKAAGANIVVSASYIFNNKNPKKAYNELRKI